MPNPVAPFGLLPVSHTSGEWCGSGRTYFIPQADTNAYAIGDPVALAGSADSKGVASCVLVTAGGGNLVLGPIIGMGGKAYGGAIGVDPISQDRIIIPATKTQPYYVFVADDPLLVFAIREGNTGTPFAATDVGLNCSLAAGTNNGFISTWILDNTTEATTTALQMKLLGLRQVLNNDFGLSAEWLVMINNHNFKPASAGV